MRAIAIHFVAASTLALAAVVSAQLTDTPTVDGLPGPPPMGSIRAEGGHLVGAGGRRVRFWGVNCVDEVGRSYREIDQIVARIQQMGFNAIRLHLYDSRLIDVDAVNADGEPTSRTFRTPGIRGDGSRDDRFDYFVYRAEKAGLYLYLTFDRLRARFRAGDYGVLPRESPRHEKAWKEAVEKANPKSAAEHLYYIDERLGACQAEYVRRQLGRRNAYTGLRCADDPYVALYELTNENGISTALVEGTWTKWPQFFHGVLQRRWNAWLLERHGSDTALRMAWGSLAEGESLSRKSVVVLHGESAKTAPAARLVDYRRFVYDVVVRYSRQLHDIIARAGSASADAPVTYDTVYQHKHTWYHPASQGTLLAVGTYVTGVPFPEKSRGRLGTPYKASYNMSHATVADTPTVVYETNIHKPAAYRAHYPLWMAAFASLRDWDGVFWYLWSNGTVRDQTDPQVYVNTGLRYSVPSHIWHGIVIATDEVLLASLRLAGEVFKHGAIPPMPDPVTVTVGANDLLGRSSWVGDLTLTCPPGAPGPYHLSYALAATDFLRGCVYRYDIDQHASRVTTPLLPSVPYQVEPVPGVRFDFERALLTIDTPRAKAVVGFVSDGHRFDDGVRLGKCSRDFVCFGLAATDGRSLEESDRAVLVLCSRGENRGLKLSEKPEEREPKSVSVHARTTLSWGSGPPDIKRVASSVELGREWGWRLRDFVMDTIREGSGRALVLAEQDPLFWAELERPTTRSR